MAGQNYYDPNRNQKKPSSDLGYWITAAVFLFMGAWPVSLIMLLVKLTSDKKINNTVNKMTGRTTSQRVSARPQNVQDPGVQRQTSMEEQYAAYREQQARMAQAAAARREEQQTAARKKLQTEKTVLRQPKKGARVLMVVGAILAIVGAVAVFGTLAEMVSWGYYNYLLEQIFSGLGFLVCGGVMYGAGRGMRKKERRIQNYLRVIQEQRIVLLKTLASVAGVSVRRTIRDLEEMLEEGRLPAGAFVDRTRECLVLDPAAMPYQKETEATLQREEPAAPQEKAPADAPAGEYARILQSIRTANEDILDETMSAKIDHIENITRSIFAIVEQKPERKQEIRSFFNYYLPTTQKLLDFYAQLEAQPVQSQTIVDSRKNIEGIMDNLVRGFENQLDSLFRADALDISSDISVLENMLAQDGLNATPGEDAIAAAAARSVATPRSAAESRGAAAPAVQPCSGSAAATAVMPLEK